MINDRCAGLDVGKDEVVACIRVPDDAGGRHQELRTFPTFSSGLESPPPGSKTTTSPRW